MKVFYDGKIITLDITDSVCQEFGFESGDRVVDIHDDDGGPATVLGVGKPAEDYHDVLFWNIDGKVDEESGLKIVTYVSSAFRCGAKKVLKKMISRMLVGGEEIFVDTVTPIVGYSDANHKSIIIDDHISFGGDNDGYLVLGSAYIKNENKRAIVLEYVYEDNGRIELVFGKENNYFKILDR